jgi:hypothetical protein
MTTSRRYESGRLVDDKRAETPKLGWGAKGEKPAVPAPDATDEPCSPAKVVRRPPPVVVPEPAPVEALPVAPTEIAPAAPPPEAPPSADEEITDTSNMRKFLLRQMVRAAKGEITTETVKNIVTLSQQVYNATSLELKAAMILKNTDKSIRALELVSPQDRDE